jgi:NAD(P)-dependent dehydrogenase (short-subunit alcohol dehydrogenase family)
VQRLKNKTAIVTGAAHGIGRAIAQSFVSEGASVFVLDLDKKAGAATAKEIGAAFIACDVSSPQAVSRAIKAAAKKSGRIDILCNNAAFIGQWHNARESRDIEWDKCYRVALMGTEYCTREVLPYMIKQKGGSIIKDWSAVAIRRLTPALSTHSSGSRAVSLMISARRTSVATRFVPVQSARAFRHRRALNCISARSAKRF